MGEVKPIAMPGTHQKFLAHFKKQQVPKEANILDVGAGHGAFTKTLFEMGYNVAACDLFPEIFHYDQIECKKVDITKPFPYDDNSFDVVIAVEVTEHVNDHEVFFSEVNRILKPGGTFYISTPNILSFKSRWRFFASGFYYSFNPLELKNYDGLQHVASLTLDQYNYIAVKSGFNTANVATDKHQSTSKILYFFYYPWAWLYTKIKGMSTMHNTKTLLLGRLLFLSFKRPN